jgi:hypothetical protein
MEKPTRQKTYVALAAIAACLLVYFLLPDTSRTTSGTRAADSNASTVISRSVPQSSGDNQTVSRSNGGTSTDPRNLRDQSEQRADHATARIHAEARGVEKSSDLLVEFLKYAESNDGNLALHARAIQNFCGTLYSANQSFPDWYAVFRKAVQSQIDITHPNRETLS